jgi:hypothetical protein
MAHELSACRWGQVRDAQHGHPGAVPLRAVINYAQSEQLPGASSERNGPLSLAHPQLVVVRLAHINRSNVTRAGPDLDLRRNYVIVIRSHDGNL